MVSPNSCWVTGNSYSPPSAKPTARSRNSNSQSRWAMRCSAGRAPMLTSHSRRVASSTSAAHQNARDGGPFREFQDALARDLHDRAAGQRGDAVVHLLEDEHVQIAEVARNEVGH